MFGFDRKLMEEERLARLAAKRKQPDDSTLSSTGENRNKVSEWRNRKRARPNGPLTAKTRDMGPIEPQIAHASESSTLLPHFTKGTVKRTWSPYHPRETDVQFTDIVQKDHLNTALFSSYQWDLDWLFGHVNMQQTKIVLVMGAKTAAEKEQYLREVEQQGLMNVKLCFPNLPERGRGIMHSKLMLLFYDKFCRVVVPTANLVAYDWGDAAGMENTVFVIDLPRRADGLQAKEADLTGFVRALRNFMEAMGVPKNFVGGLMNFEWSGSAELGFVYSAYSNPPGVVKHVGMQSLSLCVREMNLQTGAGGCFDYVTSSLGALDRKLIANIKEAAQGQFSLHPNLADNKTKRSFKVYFPSLRQVKKSIGGVQNAGTVCLSRTMYSLSTFYRAALHEHHSTRPGLLSHSKILFVRAPARTMFDREASQKRLISWCYIGSANLTASAWGSRTKQGFTCRNWECGVVLKGREHECSSRTVEADENTASSLEHMFQDVMEVPMKELTTQIGDSDEPWFFEEHLEPLG